MSVTISQNKINIREKLTENIKRSGFKGKQLLESKSSNDARTILKAGKRNLLINGGFDIWQRGTSFTGTGHTADRWYINNGWTLEQSTDVPNSSFKYSMRCHGNAVDPYVTQKIEGLLLKGQENITISFWIKAISGSLNTTQYLDSFNPHNVQSLGLPYGHIGNKWQHVTHTFTVSDVHTNSNDRFDWRIDFKENEAFDIYITGIQLEIGDEATEYEHRPIGKELELCRRYTRVSDINSRVNEYSYEMRTTPTISGAGPYIYDAEL